MKKQLIINFKIFIFFIIDKFFVILQNIKSYIRIIKMSKKPSMNEYLQTIKISLIGIFTIGILGFIFYFIMDIIPKMV